jgi:signal peptidase II
MTTSSQEGLSPAEPAEHMPPTPMTKRRGREGVMMVLIAAVVLAADQLSKNVVLQSLPLGAEWAPIPSLSWLFVVTHISNSGAAFGLFPQLGPVLMVVAVVVTVGIVIYSRQLITSKPLVALALGLQLGGALGNLVDRLRFGRVVDFLYLKVWPVSNIADISIVVGVILLLWTLLRTPEATAAPKAETDGQSRSSQPADQ